MRSYDYVSPEQKFEQAKTSAQTTLHQVRQFAEAGNFGENFADNVNGKEIDSVRAPSLRDLVSDVINFSTESETFRILKTNWEELDMFVMIAGMDEKLRKTAYKELKPYLPAVNPISNSSRLAVQPL